MARDLAAFEYQKKGTSSQVHSKRQGTVYRNGFCCPKAHLNFDRILKICFFNRKKKVVTLTRLKLKDILI